MPTYDYRCEHCGHEFSQVQRFTEGAIESCPSCGRRPTRLFSPPAIVFKGSGWYKTDSRKTPSEHTSDTKPASSDGSSKSDSSSKKDPGPSTAPAPKTAAAKDGGGSASGGSSA